MFECNQCGLCCCNLHESSIYNDLDRGDGICKYFEETTRLCSIYEDRPLKCRVDDMYYIYFRDEMSLLEYYRLNSDACNILRKRGNKNVFDEIKGRK